MNIVLKLVDRYNDVDVYSSRTTFTSPIYGCIGEKVRVEFECTDSGIIYGFDPFDIGAQIFVNSSLWQPSGWPVVSIAPPQYGWTIIISSAHTIGVWYPMAEFGLTNIYPLLNFGAYYQRLAGGGIRIRIGFGNTHDLKGFVRNITTQNHRRLLNRSFYDSVDLENGDGQSVYGVSAKEMAFVVWSRSSDGMGGYINDADYLSQEVQLYFWNYQAINKFFGPAWTYSVNGVNIGGHLAAYERTKVSFKIEKSSVDAILECVFGLIKVDEFDDSIDYVTNYNLLHNKAVTNTGTGTINEAFCNPAQKLTWSGLDATAEITIDPTYLQIGGKYRIFAIVYTSDKNTDVIILSQGFISDELELDYVEPIACGLNYNATLFDIKNKYMGNEAQNLAPGMRFKSRIDLDYAYNLFSDLCTDNLGFTPTNNDARPFITKATFEIYWDNGNTRHIFDRAIFNWNSGAGQYVVPANGNTGIFGTDYEDGTFWEYVFRLRYETNINVMETWISGVLQAAGTIPVDMRGKSMLCHWIFEYSYPAPCLLQNEYVTIEQEFDVADFQTSEMELDFIKFLGSGEIEVAENQFAVYCSGDDCCVDVKVNEDSQGPFHYLMAEVVSIPYSQAQIKEWEEWDGGNLAQLQQSPLISVDTLMTWDGASWYIGRACIYTNIEPGKWEFIGFDFPYILENTDEPEITVTVNSGNFIFTNNSPGTGIFYRYLIHSIDYLSNQNSYNYSIFDGESLPISSFVEYSPGSYAFKIYVECTVNGSNHNYFTYPTYP